VLAHRSANHTLFGGGLHTDPRQLCLVALVAPLSCTVPFLMPTMCSFLSFDVAMRWASIEHDELVVGLRPNRLARLAGWALIEHDSWDAAWQRIVIGAVRLASAMVRAEGDGQAWRTARWPVCEKRRAAVGAGGAVIAASRLAFTPLLEIATCAECHKLHDITGCWRCWQGPCKGCSSCLQGRGSGKAVNKAGTCAPCWLEGGRACLHDTALDCRLCFGKAN